MTGLNHVAIPDIGSAIPEKKRRNKEMENLDKVIEALVIEQNKSKEINEDKKTILKHVESGEVYQGGKLVPQESMARKLTPEELKAKIAKRTARMSLGENIKESFNIKKNRHKLAAWMGL